MNIIPAIDIKNGKVVKAINGERSLYNPIKSDSGFSPDPHIFIKQMIGLYRPSLFYIADINSLCSDNDNIELIRSISDKNKGIKFWVDTGGKIDQRLNKKNIIPILCSENCHKIKNINYIYKDYIHSYDYKDKFLGTLSFSKLNSSYKNKVIFMNISDVGNINGPNYSNIRSKTKNSTIEYYVGGGIKTTFDINRLKLMGFSGVLVSSLLFKKNTSSFLIKKRASK
tara:strand:+ start:539 stop:1216 length:678 start_codon:yes stop_codon:yes gene_type:complete